jgi:LAT3 family solute carrier family 43 protein 3
MEVVLFGGVIFGWGSLVFILKEEGFYLDYCTQEETGNNSNIVLSETLTSVTVSNSSIDKPSYTFIDGNNSTSAFRERNADGMLRGCPEQESKLNLWFSISVSFMYLSFAGIGYLIRHIGTRYTRAIFL